MLPSLNQPLVCPELIGRDGAVSEIDAVARWAAQGRGTVILVSGEAGVGKSRLLSAAAESLTAKGWRLVRGAFYEQDGSFAFAGVADLLRGLLAACPESTLNALQPYRSEIERLLPDLATGDTAPSVANRDPEQEKRRIHLALLSRVSGRDDEALLPLIKELIAAQLVVEEREDRPARNQLDELTGREAEVAAMVVRGFSNRAIVDELVLSSRTVETHIANAMAKLGFSSRSQLAAWAAGHGLLDTTGSQ